MSPHKEIIEDELLVELKRLKLHLSIQEQLKELPLCKAQVDLANRLRLSLGEAFTLDLIINMYATYDTLSNDIKQLRLLKLEALAAIDANERRSLKQYWSAFADISSNVTLRMKLLGD